MTSKPSTSQLYADWTPDMQVTALKRSAYAVFIFMLGLTIFFLQTQVFDLPTGVDILLFMAAFACHAIAFICYASGGMLLEVGPFVRPRFSDEYCREVLFKAYQATAWVLLMTLGASWLTLTQLLSWIGVEQISASMVAGGFLLLGSVTWAVTVVRQLSDTGDESDE